MHALRRCVADTWMAENQWFFSDELLVQAVKTAVTLQFHGILIDSQGRAAFLCDN